MDKKEIGERLMYVRKNLNMTQAKFGDLVGISGQYLCKLEKGLHELSSTQIVKICEKTGISADHILFGDIDYKSRISGMGITQEQISIAFDILKKVASFVNTDNCNELLIQEVMKQKAFKNSEAI